MKVIDCFPFLNELELLEIRLHEMSPFVDRFVIVESAETFTGNPKPLIFMENKNNPEFKEFLPKIVHIVAPLYDKPIVNRWDICVYQRMSLNQGLEDCAEDDLIITGDVDEINRGQDFDRAERVRHTPDFFTPVWQVPYFYYVNLRAPKAWPGNILIRYKTLKEVFSGSHMHARFKRRHGNPVKYGGWHFCSLGGIDKVLYKYRSVADSSVVTENYHDREKLHQMMHINPSIKNGRKLEKVPIDDSYPRYLVENLNKFKHLIFDEKRI